jgi:hypothetical protein
MSIKLVSTGGGSVTIAEPNTASDFTLSVPAQTGNVAVDGPAFSVAVTSQSISHVTTTTVQFQTVVFDTANCFNTSTYRYTPNVAGYYWLSFTSSSSSLGSGETFAFINKNGSGSLVYDLQASNVWSQSGGILHYANGTTDYFTVSLYHSAGVSKSFDGNTRFHGYLVRAA